MLNNSFGEKMAVDNWDDKFRGACHCHAIVGDNGEAMSCQLVVHWQTAKSLTDLVLMGSSKPH